MSQKLTMLFIHPYHNRSKTTQYYPIASLSSVFYLACDMGLHYLTFMGRKLENKKKLTPVRIMNSASINSKNIVNNVSIFNDSVVMTSILRGY